MKTDSSRWVIALAAALVAACGLIDGIKGPRGIPGASGAALSTGTWTSPVSIDQGASVASTAPSLAWGQSAAWVAWWSFDLHNNTASAWVTRRPHGGSFAAPKPLPLVAGFDGGTAYPKIAIGESGDAVVAVSEWVLDSNTAVTASSIWAAPVAADLAIPPSAMVHIESGDGIFGVNSLAADDSGQMLMAFGDNGVHAYVATMTTNGAWSQGQQVDNSPGVAALQVAAGSQGNALVTWGVASADGTSGDYDVFAERIFLGGGGFAVGSTEKIGTGYAAQKATAMRGDQGMAVEGSSSGLQSNTYSPDSWHGAQTVPSAQPLYYFSPTLAVNSRGQAVLLWREAGSASNTDGYGGALYASFWNGSLWSAKQLISTASPDPHAWWAAVDLNDKGEAVAAWADFEASGRYTRIFARILETSSGTPTWGDAVAIDQDAPDAGLANQPQNFRAVSVALERAGGTAQIIWIQNDPDGLAAHTWATWIETN
jgi:hypothetical protein